MPEGSKIRGQGDGTGSLGDWGATGALEQENPRCQLKDTKQQVQNSLAVNRLGYWVRGWECYGGSLTSGAAVETP